MLDLADVREVIRPLMERAMAPSRVQEIRIDEVAGFEGEEALDVLVVADIVPASGIDGRTNAAVDALHALQERGENRFPYIRYAEPAWLELEQDEEWIRIICLIKRSDFSARQTLVLRAKPTRGVQSQAPTMRSSTKSLVRPPSSSLGRSTASRPGTSSSIDR